MTAAVYGLEFHAASGCAKKMDADLYSRSKAEVNPELRPDAPAFVPQDFKMPPKLKTSKKDGKKGDVYKVLDAVPFTPSQGIRTPSPNNMAALRWQLYSPFTRFSPDSPRSMLCNFSGVPSESSSSDTSATQPGSPMQTMPPPSSVYSPFMFCPVGFPSPAPSFHTAEPASPMPPPSPLLPGSPVSTPRGGAFSTFTAAPYGSSHFAPFGPLYSVQSVPNTLPSECMAANPPYMFAEPAFKPAYQVFPPPPFPVPSPFITTPERQPPPYPAFPSHRQELTSAFQTAAHHLQPMLHPASSLPQPGSRFVRHRARLARSMELPPEMDLESASSMKAKFKQRKSSSDPRPGAEAQPRLNARQRRTLRRAKERALKALTETSQKMLVKAGVTSMPEDPGTPVSSYSNSTSATAMNTSPSRSPDSDSGEGSNFGDKDDNGKYDDIDSLDISDLIQQLQVRAEEGLVDEKLVRDLQIIQGLLGALKQPVPTSKPAAARSRLSRLTIGSESSGTHSQSPSPTPM